MHSGNLIKNIPSFDAVLAMQETVDAAQSAQTRPFGYHMAFSVPLSFSAAVKLFADVIKNRQGLWYFQLDKGVLGVFT